MKIDFSPEHLKNLVCPSCKHPLTVCLDRLVCNKCSVHWHLEDGIPFFSKTNINNVSKIEEKQIKKLLNDARSERWDIALYEYYKENLLKNKFFLEDERLSDWIYLLPLSKDYVTLVIGCGLGTIPITLSKMCSIVYAIDPEWWKITFLNLRKNQQRIDNLYPIYVNNVSFFPFPDKYFDLISLRIFDFPISQLVPFREVAKHIYDLLKIGGIAYFSLPNRWGYQRLLWRGKRNFSISLHTIYGYKQILQEQGFSNVRFYTSLPYYDGIPLFSVPLGNAPAINFCFRFIFPLTEMVPPETKRVYSFEYGFAKVSMHFIRRFRFLLKLVKFFVPGFNIIARKSG